MNIKTQKTLETILASDDTISKEAIQRAISILNGYPIDRRDFVRVIKIEDAAKMLGVTRNAISGYLRHGYLSKVVSPFGGTLGIRSDSLEAFMRPRSTPKTKANGSAK